VLSFAAGETGRPQADFESGAMAAPSKGRFASPTLILTGVTGSFGRVRPGMDRRLQAGGPSG